MGTNSWDIVSQTKYQPKYPDANELNYQESDDVLCLYFGESVAISGDWAIVGAYRGHRPVKNYTGTAYLYKWDGGTWQQKQKIYAEESETTGYDHFGYSVAIDGNRLVVGAPWSDGPGANAGAAYVFQLETEDGQEIWKEQQRIVSSSIEAGYQFGDSVGIQSKWVVVGAPKAKFSGVSTGLAYTFRLGDTSWEQIDTLSTGLLAVNDDFGSAVDITNPAGDIQGIGKWGIVGAPLSDGDGTINSGAAYIFGWNKNTQKWELFEALKTTVQLQSYDNFGCSVAIDGNFAVVGSDGRADGGIAYVFKWNGQTWNFQQEIKATDLNKTDKFGCSVAISGNTIMVGSKQHDQSRDQSPSTSNVGAAYIFTLEGGTWKQKQKLVAADWTVANDELGYSVAIDGNKAMAGTANSNHIVYGFESR